ncbi:MAG: COX15/CtaA family protein [Pirellulales bacterium]|nr:COX15/CtaA family protein [Pirellulales bacterium]
MTTQTVKPSISKTSAWPHRVAWALLVATFAMISIGGLVTTYTAGMAVPDWPTTFGHNPLLYPLHDWLNVWDVFLEHGHRLFGLLVGTLAFVLAVLLWKTDERPSMRRLGLIAVAVLCTQELWGGLRVLGDDLLLAKIHGCTAPLFLAVVATIVTCTSPAWRRATPVGFGTSTRRLHWLTSATLVAAYIQIALGAQIRHLPPTATTGWFVLWVWLHLIAAGTLVVMTVATVVLIRRQSVKQPRLHHRAWWLAALVLVQLTLGASSWVTSFGWPLWFTDLVGPLKYTVVAEGRLQVLATTTHVVIGSLCLVVALSLTLWSRRLAGTDDSPSTPGKSDR